MCLPSSLLADGNISSKAVCLYAILLDEIHRNVRYGRGSCIDKADQLRLNILRPRHLSALSCIRPSGSHYFRDNLEGVGADVVLGFGGVFSVYL